jgi:hypothetical protein
MKRLRCLGSAHAPSAGELSAGHGVCPECAQSVTITRRGRLLVHTRLCAPTVHLNGTDRAGLLAQLTTARNAVEAAMDAVRAAAPHARDYYERIDSTFPVARVEHILRIARLQSVRDELVEIHQAVCRQAHGRR